VGRVRRVFHAGAGGPREAIVLDRAESKHVARVLRLGPGDAVSVFDGRGREWEGVLESVGEREVRVRLGAERTSAVEPPLDVVLFQALCRHDRMEWVIQKATEVGVAEIRPFRSERVEGPAPSGSRLERWRRIAVEACKQSGRRRVPEIRASDGLPPSPPEGITALALDGGAGSVPIGERLASEPPAGVWLAVGPEGGFSPSDRARLEAGGWVRVGLGPRTLRTETAGVVAAGILLHAWADLGR
jgi:16S rRNA (uracil1498-N3)-methyltransferase